MGKLRTQQEQGVLTGLLDDEANTTKGKTSTTAIVTLAAIRVLKEKRRRRFVAIGGVEPRRDAYRGIVHDDEKINAVAAIGYGKKKIAVLQRCWARLN
jgi:hypothetical protein